MSTVRRTKEISRTSDHLIGLIVGAVAAYLTSYTASLWQGADGIWPSSYPQMKPLLVVALIALAVMMSAFGYFQPRKRLGFALGLAIFLVIGVLLSLIPSAESGIAAQVSSPLEVIFFVKNAATNATSAGILAAAASSMFLFSKNARSKKY